MNPPASKFGVQVTVRYWPLEGIDTSKWDVLDVDDELGRIEALETKYANPIQGMTTLKFPQNCPANRDIACSVECLRS